MNKIIVDAFGGDNAPAEIIDGSLSALTKRKDFSLVLVGNEEVIKDILSEKSYDADRVEVVNAKDVITCEEEPVTAVRRKPESSVCVGFSLLKENEDCKAFVSAGSTGAVLTGATLKLGRIEGVKRPALSPLLPTVIEGKNVILLDAGANADCKPINLLQFAVMGSTYANVLGIENPKVGLLSNGTEDEKGNELNHTVFPILKSIKNINFVGNIEARDILSGEIDVVVADGFSGNVALKSIEGGVFSLLNILKKEIYSSFKGKLGGLLLKSTFKRVVKTMDYNKKGGALFLGVKKPVIKAHGSSKSTAFCNAVLQAVEFADVDFSNKITEDLSQAELPQEF